VGSVAGLIAATARKNARFDRAFFAFLQAAVSDLIVPSGRFCATRSSRARPSCARLAPRAERRLKRVSVSNSAGIGETISFIKWLMVVWRLRALVFVVG
jgi:hypothetical protein